jgi:double-stranded uracil-DNA glycosylase
MPILPDVLEPNLKVVFCGTAAGEASAKAGAYYAKSTNKFWRTLHSVGLTPVKVAPVDFLTVTQYGIGLTDLAKEVSGQDHIIAQEEFDFTGFEERILKYQPRIVAFTSKRGAAEYFKRPTAKIAYGLQEEKIGETRIFVLTSPSGAAGPHWDEAPWQELANLVKDDSER